MDNFVGKRLDGRYELREIIGVGGMSVVYKAYDNIDDRIVAVKILKDEFLHNEEFKRRFKNESKAIAVLSHKNIVRVYNVSFGDRIQYIVEELVDGITLKEYIEQQGIVNWKEAVHFVGQILQALQHAHDKGIVHQDIKPQNIMLLSDGTIKVADFGIARFSRSDIDTTSENAIGSVHYISPEQARGEVTDEKADIYSVGVLLYEMITGKLPFQGDSAVSIALMQLQQDPTLPRELNPSIPLGLEQITMRAMQKNTSERYQTASEMLMDINEFKKNPAVKFNYIYFIDQSPTKYVPKNTSISEANDSPAVRDNGREKQGINKTTAVIVGAAAGILVLLILIISLILGGRKVEVPNFINMNYYNDIENNEEYKDFKFVVVPAEDTTPDNGTVLEQDPEAATKVKKKSTITLTVVIKDSIVLDESLIGMSEEDAKQYLLAQGLQVGDITYEYSEDQKAGIVIASNPEPGNQVKVGSQIDLTITTDKQETVPVPDLTNMTKEDAETVLKAANLRLGTVTKVDSDKDEGLVVSQSVKADEKVPIDSAINISISNGKPSKSTAKITVTLPDTQSNGIVKIYINSELVYTSKELFLNGESKSFEVEGSGTDNSYTVTVNDNKVQTGKIDFTSDSPSPTDVKDYEYVEEIVLPNVVGKTKEDAEKTLSAAGFTNVTIKEVENSATAGTVFEQSPDASSGSYKCSPDTKITLKIAKAAETKQAEETQSKAADSGD